MPRFIIGGTAPEEEGRLGSAGHVSRLANGRQIEDNQGSSTTRRRKRLLAGSAYKEVPAKRLLGAAGGRVPDCEGTLAV